MKGKFYFLITILFTGVIRFQSPAQVYQVHPIGMITNPYYNAKAGRAKLIKGDSIQGKFYYHTAISADDSFYFYPSGIKSLRIIPIKEFKQVEFMTKRKEWIKYCIDDEKLRRKLPNGKIEILTANIFYHQFIR